MVWIKHYASKLAQAVSVGLDRRFPVCRTGGVTAQEYSFICLTPEIELEQLKKLALYIAQRIKLYNAYNETVFDEQLLLLIDHRILSYNSFDMISTYHDLDYIELTEMFSNSPFKGMFSQYTYEFLLIHRKDNNYENLICKHSHEANINNWEIINLRYAKKLFWRKQVYDSHDILLRLEKSKKKLHPLQILFMGLVAYEAGCYELAIKRLELLQLEELRFSLVKYYYLFYLGKSYNNIGKVNEAILRIEKAITMVQKDSLKYAQILNVLHMFYFEVPEKVELSKRIFFYIKKSYENLYPETWANTMRGCQNFMDNVSSLGILQKAKEKLNDDVEKAFIKNTMGFIFVKMDQLADAEREFFEASNTIKNLKIHEYSYAANNLALCYMLVEKYEQAKNVLLEALFWNKTNYGSLVIQTHLMMCALYLNQFDESNNYYNYLVDYMESHKVVDPIVNRKIYMNLAIFCSETGNPIMKQTYFNKAASFVKNSSSEWRYSVHVNKSNKSDNKLMSKYMLTTAFEPWFLVYAHD